MSKKAAKQKSKRNLLYFCACCLTVLILVLAGFNLNSYLAKPKVLGTKINTAELLKEKSFWQKVVTDNPTYQDGWLELAKIEYLLDNKEAAQKDLETATKINPNSEKINAVRQELGF